MACDAQSVETLSVTTDKYYELSERQWLECLANLFGVIAVIPVGLPLETKAVALAYSLGYPKLSDVQLEQALLAAFTASAFDAQSIVNEIQKQGYDKLSHADLRRAIIAAYCGGTAGSAQTVETLAINTDKLGRLSENDVDLGIEAVICAANSTQCLPPSLLNWSGKWTELSDRGLREILAALAQYVAVVTPPIPTTPTGFVFASNITFANVVAGWDVPPAGITGTEVWTGTDGITYALATTVAAPGVTNNQAIPAIGNSIYAKIRWVTASAQSAFTTAVQFKRSDWETRALANSGGPIMASSKSIQNNFYSALINAGILARIYTANMYDKQRTSINEAKTPIVNTAGNDPWTLNNMGDADIGANGLISAGSGGMYPVANASTLYGSDTDAGFTVYAFNNTAGLNAYDLGYTNNAGTLACAIQINTGGTTNAKIWNDTSVISIACPGAGYYSVNRVGPTDFHIYFGNSITPHVAVGQSVANSGTRQAQRIDAFSVFAYEGPTDALFTPRTLGFTAFHHGLTAAESALLFAAVQASLVYSGGGSA
jgi:hypothetical protein